MPRVNLTWYQPIARRIMRDVRNLKQTDIARIEGVTRQAVSHKLKVKNYDNSLEVWIQILDKAGYEIKEKEA